MTDPTPELHPHTAARRSRFEVRTVLAVVAALIVLGGLYVLVFGSPTRNRAAMDSVNAPIPSSLPSAAASTVTPH